MSEQDFIVALGRIAARQPESTAVIDGPRTVPYGDLWRAVTRAADALSVAGLRPGDRVALVAENSVDYLVSAFAVWHAGGVLATIYPSSGADDLAYCLDNSDPALVLADRGTAKMVSAVAPDRPVAVIDDGFAVPRVRDSTMPNPDGLGEQLALICYTSGTTSRPKAVMISTSALFNCARTYADVWRLSTADRTVVCLPMAWLYGLDSTSMAALLAGGTVISLPRARPALITDAIVRHRATVLPGVTTMFAKLVEHLHGLPELPDLSSLRFCVSGGEPRNEAAFAHWSGFTGRPIHDTFCSSECFPLITYDPVADPQPRPGAAGKLVPRAELKIVDAAGVEVPVGEVGEALSRGAGLMLGYWRDPERTRAALTDDGWYRTNDLVRVDESGYVHVVGRLSDMIIRGGSNVSPGEIERVLREHPSVRDAAVVGLPDPTYGQRVVAALVVRDPESFDSEQVAQFCAERLAAYKVPTAYAVVAELPQNPATGKVNRRQVAAALAGTGEVPS